MLACYISLDFIYSYFTFIRALFSKTYSTRGIGKNYFLRIKLINAVWFPQIRFYLLQVMPDQLKPVLVFIHGGGFISGSNETKDLGPEFIMTEDIVMVTVNYRLGLLGFLRLDDEELGVPGNAGLKDQSMALRWVQSNIEMFGGDPNQVTVGGESAGGASVHYQTLSPMSEGLFQRAIIQSGFAICPWAVTDHNVIEILAAAGIDVRDENEAIDCLKNLPGEEVYQIQEKFFMVSLVISYF